MKPRNYAKRGSRSNGSTPNFLSTHRIQKDSPMFSVRIINVVKTSLEKQKKKIGKTPWLYRLIVRTYHVQMQQALTFFSSFFH